MAFKKIAESTNNLQTHFLAYVTVTLQFFFWFVILDVACKWEGEEGTKIIIIQATNKISLGQNFIHIAAILKIQFRTLITKSCKVYNWLQISYPFLLAKWIGVDPNLLRAFRLSANGANILIVSIWHKLGQTQHIPIENQFKH